MESLVRRKTSIENIGRKHKEIEGRKTHRRTEASLGGSWFDSWVWLVENGVDVQLGNKSARHLGERPRKVFVRRSNWSEEQTRPSAHSHPRGTWQHQERRVHQVTRRSFVRHQATGVEN